MIFLSDVFGAFRMRFVAVLLALVLLPGMEARSNIFNDSDQKQKVETCFDSRGRKKCKIILRLDGGGIKEGDIDKALIKWEVLDLTIKEPGAIPSNLCKLTGIQELEIFLSGEKIPKWTDNIDCLKTLIVQVNHPDLSWLPRIGNLKRLYVLITFDDIKYQSGLLPKIDFSRFPELEDLTLSYHSKSERWGENLPPIQLPESLKVLSKLRNLSIESYKNPRLLMNTFLPSLRGLSSLENLSLNDFNLSSGFSNSLPIKGLRLTNITNTMPIDLNLFPKLENLWIKPNLGKENLYTAPKAGTLPNLVDVYIDGANISAFPAEFVGRKMMQRFFLKVDSCLSAENSESILRAIKARPLPKTLFSLKVEGGICR